MTIFQYQAQAIDVHRRYQPELERARSLPTRHERIEASRRIRRRIDRELDELRRQLD